MLRNAELEELKAKVDGIETRLQWFRHRIKDMEQALCPGTMMAVVDERKCMGCGACQDVCPTGAIVVDRVAHIDPSRCMGCGRCVDGCPKAALSLRLVTLGLKRQAAPYPDA